MKYIILIFVLASATSCSNEFQANCKNKVEIEYVNKRDEYSTLIFSNGQDSILLDEKENSKPLCFSKDVTTDGCYLIKIKGPTKDSVFLWGYYSNGTPSEKSIKLTLEKDSVSIKSEDFRSFY